MAEQVVGGLKWVKGEIAATLRRVRDLVEAYSARGERAGLGDAVDALFEVRGVLLALQLTHPARLVEEMQRLAEAMAQDTVAKPEESAEALMLALIQLPNHLDRLDAGAELPPLSLWPTINDLRESRGVPALSQAELLVPASVLADQDEDLGGEELDSLSAVVRKVRPHFHRHLVAWYKPETSEEGLSKLARLFDNLYRYVQDGILADLFQLAEIYANALLGGQVPSSPEARTLVGHVDRVLKRLVPVPPQWPGAEAAQLVDQLLAALAESGIQSPAVAELQARYGQTAAIEGITEGASEALAGLAASMLGEIASIKTELDLFVRGERDDRTPLDGIRARLRTLATTLEVADTGRLPERVRELADGFGDLAMANAGEDALRLEPLAAQLLAIESVLRAHAEHRTPPKEDASATGLFPAELTAATLREVRGELGRVKDAILACETPGTRPAIFGDIPGQLARIAGALQILGDEPAARLSEDLGALVQRRYLAAERWPREAELERLADVLVALEVYIDQLLEEGAPYADDLIGQAGKSLALLDTMLASGLRAVSSERPPESEEAPESAGRDDAGRHLAGATVSPEILNVFLEEARDEIDAVGTQLARWQSHPGDEVALGTLRRSFHTLKGSGRLVGAEGVARLAQIAEEVLDRVIDRAVAPDASLFDFVADAAALLPGLVAAEAEGRAIEIEETIERGERLIRSSEPELAPVARPGGTAGAKVIPWPSATPARPSLDTAPAPAPDSYINDTEILTFAYDEELDGGDSRYTQGAPAAVAEPERATLLAESILFEDRASVLASDDELLDIFRAETDEHLECLRAFLRRIAAGDGVPDEQTIRALHTLTGSARMAGIASVGAVTKPLELRLKDLKAKGGVVSAELATLIERAIDAVAERVAELPEHGPGSFALAELMAEVSSGSFAGADDRILGLPESPIPVADLPFDPGREIELPGAPWSESLREPAALAPATAMDLAPEIGPDLDLGFVGEIPAELEAEGWAPLALPDLPGPLVAEIDTAEATPVSDPIMGLAEAPARDAGGDAPWRVEAESAETPVPWTLATPETEAPLLEPAPASPPLTTEISAAPADSPTELEPEPEREPDSEPVLEAASALGAEPSAPTAEQEAETPSETRAPAAVVAPFALQELATQERPAGDTVATPMPHVAPAPAPAQPFSLAAAASAGAEDFQSTSPDPELATLFLEDARDLLDSIDARIREWQLAPLELDALAGINRMLHTLKGSARLTGLTAIGDLSHALETRLTAVGASPGAIDDTTLELAQRAVDALSVQVDAVENGKAIPRVTALVEALSRAPDALVPAEAKPPAIAVLRPAAEAPAAPGDAAETVAPAGRTAAAPSPAAERAQPAGGFAALVGEREGTGAVGGIPQIRVRSDLLNRLVDNSGEISLYRARLSQRNGLLGFGLGELDQTVVRLRDRLRLLEIETEAQILHRFEHEGLSEEDGAVFDPLELDRFSTLQQLSRSLAETVNDLVSLKELLGGYQRETADLLTQQARLAEDLQDGLLRTRMVPFVQVVPRLHRLVRQTADSTGKSARLEVVGPEVELDRTILDRLVAPLEHLLRNAVDHGLERPEARLQAGKPATGAIALVLSREGNDVVIRLKDDGRGLDLVAIRRKAVAQGILAANAQIDDDALMQLVFERGFTTHERVTQISGRGVGLDVVTSEIKAANGSISLGSVAGRGTTFTIRVPLTLAIIEAFLVSAAENIYAVPHSTIEGAARIGREELAAIYRGKGGDFDYRGHRYRVAYLAGVLDPRQEPELGERRSLPLLLARVGEQRVALQVDSILESQRIVVKPLGPQLAGVRWLSGGTILPDGRVALILDALSLLRSGAVQDYLPSAPVPTVATESPLCVMVVDDSLTVRRVTSRLLRRQNMEVLTAKDGVEALTLLDERIPDLMLLDIEMPRMDGYELTRHVRRSERLRNLPIIMITSRAGDKHRDHALSLGVNRYLGKPYQESDLLEEIGSVLAEQRR